jgi:hypothetical protein
MGAYKLLTEDKSYLNLLKESVTKRPLKEADGKVKIPVEHPGVLEVPEGKDVEDLGEEHFKAIIKKKGWPEVSKALTNLHTWNEKQNPKLSSWANGMQDKLSKWVDAERESSGNESLYENEHEFDKMAARSSGKSDNSGPVSGGPSDAARRRADYDKWLAQNKKVKKESDNLEEKWAKEVDVKSTGENAGKSVAQLKAEIEALKGKPGNKEKMGKLLFALRAKQHWKKHTGL